MTHYMDICDNDKQQIIYNIQEAYSNASQHTIRGIIEKSFIPTKDEMTKNAEVSTPIILIDEMLNTIPTAFWMSPRKILEPCCGKGNFVLGIFERFFDGLKLSVPNIEQRCKIIIEDCIYFADLTEINVFTTTEMLKHNAQLFTNSLNVTDCKFNSYIGNTLMIDICDVFNVNGFNAVIGNPPYSKFNNGIISGGYGGKCLWDKFVVCALQKWISHAGYLLFVHPPSWRKPEHYLWKLLTSKQIIFLRAFSEKDGKIMFGCATLTDFYLLHNVDTHKETEFLGEDNVNYFIDLRNINFLPSGCVYEILKIVGLNDYVIYSSSVYDTRRNYMEVKQNVIYSRTFYGTDKKNISFNIDATNYLPVVHSMTRKKGLGIVYSKEDKGHFNISKVILSFGRNQYPYNDWEGKYGMSQSCFGLEIESKEEGDNIIMAINSDKFKQLLKYTKWNTFQTEWRMFKYFRKDFWKEFVN